MPKIKINLTINGKAYQVETQANKTLLRVLREDLGIISVKNACGGVGECGACTVLFDGVPVNSCLILAGQADGHEIVTVEGLSKRNELHPIQQAFIEAGAVQCGFCTPGMVLSAYYLLKNRSIPTEEEIREALAGNLCRCTGYSKIVEAVKQAAKELSHG